jgi:hypothetical protein
MGGKSRKTGTISRKLIEKLKRKSSCVGTESKSKGFLNPSDIQPKEKAE